MHEVMAMGLMSFSKFIGGLHLGSKVTREIFHWFGTSPCLIEELMMAQRGAEMTSAVSFKNLLLMKSGPVDLLMLSFFSAV